MKGLRCFAAVTAILCVQVAPVWAFKKCKMPDGRMMFTDIPPPGCVVQGDVPNPPAEQDDETAPSENVADSTESGSGDAQAIAQGRRIERELDAAADELERVKQDRANAPKEPPGVYVDVTDGSGHYVENERVRPDVAAELDAREKKVLERIQALRDEYANVTRTIEGQHEGRAPSWWKSSPRCDRCP